MSNQNLTVTSITALAIAIAEGKDADEIGLLGAIFTQIGDTLTTISVQKQFNETKNQQANDSSNQQANGSTRKQQVNDSNKSAGSK